MICVIIISILIGKSLKKVKQKLHDESVRSSVIQIYATIDTFGMKRD